MSDKELGNAAVNEQRVVVKNKKYKKNDIFAFVICLIVALIIWIYATNVQNLNMQKQDELYDALTEVSGQQTNS